MLMMLYGIYMIVGMLVWGFLLASGEVENEYALYVALLTLFFFVSGVIAHCAVLTTAKSAF
jgi:hypothetical protein